MCGRSNVFQKYYDLIGRSETFLCLNDSSYGFCENQKYIVICSRVQQRLFS